MSFFQMPPAQMASETQYVSDCVYQGPPEPHPLGSSPGRPMPGTSLPVFESLEQMERVYPQYMSSLRHLHLQIQHNPYMCERERHRLSSFYEEKMGRAERFHRIYAELHTQAPLTPKWTSCSPGGREPAHRRQRTESLERQRLFMEQELTIYPVPPLTPSSLRVACMERERQGQAVELDLGLEYPWLFSEEEIVMLEAIPGILELAAEMGFYTQL